MAAIEKEGREKMRKEKKRKREKERKREENDILFLFLNNYR